MRITNVQPSLLHTVARFASEDEQRYALCGVLVEAKPEGLTIVATDRRRIIAHKTDWRADGECQFIIPSAVIDALPTEKARVLWTVEYSQDTEVIEFIGPEFRIRCKAIASEYPNWRIVIPDEVPKHYAAGMLNHAFLAELSEALYELNASDNGLKIGQQDEHSPFVAFSIHTKIVLMPIRVKSEP